MLKYLGIVFALFTTSAYAYVPPSFFLAEKITSGRDEVTNLLAQIEVYHAAPSAKEADEQLWQQYVQLPSTFSSDSAPWPGLSILAESDKDRLVTALKKFGLPVTSEEALARYRSDQLHTMKETPRPFYNVDPNMSLRRNGKQLAWVLTSTDGTRSLWVEKNTFFPIFLRGPCPKSVEEISWAKSGDEPCELHFESISGIKTSAVKRTAAVLKKNGQPLIKFVIKKTINNPPAQAMKDALEKNSKAADSAGDLAPLMNDFMN